jgi:hypothetical protein
MNKSQLNFKNWRSKPALALALLSGAAAVRANDITAYRVQKGIVYTQTSAGTPQLIVGNPYVFDAEIAGDISSVTSAELRLPSGAIQTFSANATFEALAVSGSAPTASALNSSFGTGNYTFVTDSDNDGPSSAALNLGNATFPTAPHIANFTAAQAINPDDDFTLNWDAFAGASGNDHYQIDLIGSFGFSVFSDSGTGTSTVIPAGTLSAGDTVTAHLRFVHETLRDVASYPGALGTAGFFTETQFSLKAGGGGSGNDTTPPIFVASSPSQGATNVSRSSPVLFIFNEPMAATHSIRWSVNVNPSAFTYTWLGDQKSLLCSYAGGFPSGATITWTLNPDAGSPDNFRDVGGNDLPVGIFQGSFVLEGSTTVDPCQGTNSTGAGGFALIKMVNYVQTNNGAPALDPELGAEFFASFNPPTNFTATAVSLTGPGVNKSLSNFFGRTFFLTDEFSTTAALDAAYPAATYTITANTSAGTQTASLSLAASGGVTIPQVLNLTEFKTADVNQDFTLRFGAFAGAGSFDSIALEISDGAGSVFFLPDPCRGVYLTNTATSVVIPAGTFKTNQNYTGTLMFTHFTGASSSIPNTTGSAGVEASTKFDFTVGAGGGGTTPTAPTWDIPKLNTNGSVDLTLHGEPSRTYVIDKATALSNWSPVSTNSGAGGTITLHLLPGSGNGFFRARVNQ